MSYPIYFFGQHKNETLVFYTYRHWMHFFYKIQGVLLFLLITLVVFFVWIFLTKPEGQSIFPFLNQYLLISLSFYTLFLFHIHTLFILALNHLFNIIIVTDCRFIEVKQTIFFENNRESIDLAKVQDIQGHKNGFFENIFDYGAIHLTFSDIHDPKIIRNIPRPLQFIEYLNALKRRLLYKYEQIEEQEEFVDHNENKEIII